MEPTIGSKILCKWEDNNYYLAEIIQERTNPNHQYYVHYIGFNKRLDCWVSANRIKEISSDTPQDQSMLTRLNKRKRAELHPGDV